MSNQKPVFFRKNGLWAKDGESQMCYRDKDRPCATDCPAFFFNDRIEGTFLKPMINLKCMVDYFINVEVQED